MSLKIGNVVQLTSKKGPIMTVTRTPVNIGDVKCMWFDGAILCDGSFPADSLTIVKEY